MVSGIRLFNFVLQRKKITFCGILHSQVGLFNHMLLCRLFLTILRAAVLHYFLNDIRYYIFLNGTRFIF